MISVARSVFVAGTDTGVGKTHVCVALLRALAIQGLRVAGMKPVAAGAVLTADGLRNDDALALAAAGNVDLAYELINPVCLRLATSPQLAAQAEGMHIEIPKIARAYRQIAPQADIVIVEGAGGWLAPIGEHETMADVATALALPVVLVVGVRLGCINHALLTEAAIRRSGLTLIGWVANKIDADFAAAADTVESLTRHLACPQIAQTRLSV